MVMPGYTCDFNPQEKVWALVKYQYSLLAVHEK